MKEEYVSRNFSSASLQLIDTIDEICSDYERQGFVLTVRQLYYQLVARNIIPNTERSYKNTTSLVNDARLAGYIDWDIIEDRTREFVTRSHWHNGAGFLHSVSRQFFTDMWDNQTQRVFVIVEKEALAGVLEDVCWRNDVPLLAARGYPSVTVLREFAEEHLLRAYSHDQHSVILHLGDHDPSGIDMSRDLQDRLKMLCRDEPTFELYRIALNMDQIRHYRCPPNPAKISDSRVTNYIKNFGYESWELDALEPSALVNLVETNIQMNRDEDDWQEKMEFVQVTRKKLIDLAAAFTEDE